MHWFYYTGRFLTQVVLHLLTNWQVTGRKNVPVHEPLLIVANHLNLADPPLIAVSVNRKTVFMAKEELFRKTLPHYFVRHFGAFPVYRGRLDRDAFRQAEHWLERDFALVMFPEGMRSRDARLQPAFPGSVLIAARLGVPILPVGIAGTEQIKGKFWWLRRPRVTVNIGRVFTLPPTGGKLTREERAQLADYIMQHIAELLPPEYRGDYGKIG